MSVSGLTQGTGSATFNCGNATLQADGSFTTYMPMTLTGTSITVDTNGNDVTFCGVTTGMANLDKISAGTLNLAAYSQYGNIHVSAAH